MTIQTMIRVKHDKSNPYMLYIRKAAQDKRLSYEARGLHVYLMSKPDNWLLQIEDLMIDGIAGRDKIKNLIKELAEFGYIKRPVRYHNQETGKWEWTPHVVFESPFTESQSMDHQSMDSQSILYNRESDNRDNTDNLANAQLSTAGNASAMPDDNSDFIAKQEARSADKKKKTILRRGGKLDADEIAVLEYVNGTHPTHYTWLERSGHGNSEVLQKLVDEAYLYADDKNYSITEKGLKALQKSTIVDSKKLTSEALEVLRFVGANPDYDVHGIEHTYGIDLHVWLSDNGYLNSYHNGEGVIVNLTAKGFKAIGAKKPRARDLLFDALAEHIFHGASGSLVAKAKKELLGSFPDATGDSLNAYVAWYKETKKGMLLPGWQKLPASYGEWVKVGKPLLNNTDAKGKKVHALDCPGGCNGTGWIETLNAMKECEG